MYQVRVAFGMSISERAYNDDPKAENLELVDFEGNPIWHVYSFDTEAEANAFKLGLSEADGWIASYYVTYKI